MGWTAAHAEGGPCLGVDFFGSGRWKRRIVVLPGSLRTASRRSRPVAHPGVRSRVHCRCSRPWAASPRHVSGGGPRVLSRDVLTPTRGLTPGAGLCRPGGQSWSVAGTEPMIPVTPSGHVVGRAGHGVGEARPGINVTPAGPPVGSAGRRRWSAGGPSITGTGQRQDAVTGAWNDLAPVTVHARREGR